MSTIMAEDLWRVTTTECVSSFLQMQGAGLGVLFPILDQSPMCLTSGRALGGILTRGVRPTSGCR